MIIVNKVNRTRSNIKSSLEQFLTKFLSDQCEQSEKTLSNIKSSLEQFLTKFLRDQCEQSVKNL